MEPVEFLFNLHCFGVPPPCPADVRMHVYGKCTHPCAEMCTYIHAPVHTLCMYGVVTDGVDTYAHESENGRALSC